MLIPFDQLFEKHGLRFNGVLHIGANLGEERFVYDKLGIKKQIWIEADPEIFLKLKSNISYNADAIALNWGASDVNLDDQVFHIANNGGQSSSFLELGEHKQHHPDVFFTKDIKVNMRRVDAMGLDLTDIDFLNIDVQGFELQVLKGIGSMKNFKAVYLEINRADTYKKCAQIDEIDSFMKIHGFTRTDTRWANIWGDALFVK